MINVLFFYALTAIVFFNEETAYQDLVIKLFFIVTQPIIKRQICTPLFILKIFFSKFVQGTMESTDISIDVIEKITKATVLAFEKLKEVEKGIESTALI